MLKRFLSAAFVVPEARTGADHSYLVGGGTTRKDVVGWLIFDLPFVIVAAFCAILLPAGHKFDLTGAIIAIAFFVLVPQFELKLDVGWVSAQQTGFVLLLFTAPLNLVPAIACGGHLLALVLKRRPLARLGGAAFDSWYVIAPVLVLAVLAPGRAEWAHWPAYVTALVAQLAFNEASYISQASIFWGRAVKPREELTVVAIDTLLTPIGLMAAVNVRASPVGTAVMLASVLGLLAYTAREHEQRRTHAALALRDPLTGLANRALLEESLTACEIRCGRQNAQAGLLLLDLDDFKSINDTLGHQCGDEVLVAFAQRVEAATRDVDLVARLGGDEFAVVLAEPMTVELAQEVTARVLDALAAPLTLKGGAEITLKASVGVSLFGGGRSAFDATAEADVRLYSEKRARKRE